MPDNALRTAWESLHCGCFKLGCHSREKSVDGSRLGADVSGLHQEAGVGGDVDRKWKEATD